MSTGRQFLAKFFSLQYDEEYDEEYDEDEAEEEDEEEEEGVEEYCEDESEEEDDYVDAKRGGEKILLKEPLDGRDEREATEDLQSDAEQSEASEDNELCSKTEVVRKIRVYEFKWPQNSFQFFPFLPKIKTLPASSAIYNYNVVLFYCMAEHARYPGLL